MILGLRKFTIFFLIIIIILVFLNKIRMIITTSNCIINIIKIFLL